MREKQGERRSLSQHQALARFPVVIRYATTFSYDPPLPFPVTPPSAQGSKFYQRLEDWTSHRPQRCRGSAATELKVSERNKLLLGRAWALVRSELGG